MWPYRVWKYRHELGAASANFNLDENLIAAIMDRETLCGTASGYFPHGPGGLGDNGHGHGLMQIDDRSFPTFCKDTSQWADAGANISFGASILADNIKMLKDETCGVCAYNAGAGRVRNLITSLGRVPSMLELDQLTTGKDYVTDVYRRRNTFKKLQSNPSGFS